MSADPDLAANLPLALPAGTPTPDRAMTEQGPAPKRSQRTDSDGPANTPAPATDTQVAFIEHHFPERDWRTDVPSARELSKALGRTSTTPGNNLRKALLARAATELSPAPTDTGEPQ